jgi:hypothetical protein
MSGNTYMAGDLTIAGSKTIAGDGRLHITGPELLYLLNKNGVVIGKEWGGSGNLQVQGNMSVLGAPTYTGGRGKGGCGRFEENSLTCPDGKVMVGLEFWHPCGQDYTYQEQFRLICK